LLVRAELDEKVRYAHLLENASDAFAVVAPDGLITFCSPASERLLGYQPGDFLGHRIADLVRLAHPADAATRGRALYQVLQEPGRTAMFDIRLRHRDGRYRWLNVTTTNRTQESAVAGIVLNGHDVTAEHEADDQLRLQASILGNISEAVIATDLHGRTTHWNSGATAIYGYAADEMLGTSLARVYPNQTDEALAADIGAIGDGADFLGEWGGKRKDGSDVWVDIRTTVLRDGNGKAYGVVRVSRDVTDERATRRRLVRLQTAIENTSEAIIVVGREGRVEYVNPGFERMTGFVASRQIDVEGLSMNGAPEIAGPWSAIGDVVASGTSWSGDISGTKIDGAPFQASVVVSPIREPGDEPSGYVVVARDVTEERRYEETARQQARERALIAETIRAIDGHGTDDEIATAICRQVARLPEVQVAALFVFAGDGQAVPTGTFLTNGQEPPTMSLPLWRAAELREQCQRGPWIEAWHPNPDHPYDAVFDSMDLKATAFAPVRDGKDVVGVLIVNSSSDNADQLLAEALPALVEFAEITSTVIGARLADRTINNTALATLVSVIALHAFHPVYQPIVDVEVGRIVGYEGLTRFDDGTDPEKRFREAAALGMSKDLEVAAFREIIEGAESLQSDAWLNVNLSPAVIRNSPELADIIAASERKIVIEVTEREAIDDYAAFRDAMHRLGPRVRLAVDDAGAGFASMRHIVELRPDYVKLDRAVITGINHDEARRALAVGMRQFARTAGFWLIAEGVETPAELRTLREIDIHYIQ
ncbi:MAG TPA: PAS domain S-box protein, partial [Candidatus Limnocylindrales bacterium]